MTIVKIYNVIGLALASFSPTLHGAVYAGDARR